MSLNTYRIRIKFAYCLAHRSTCSQPKRMM